MIAAGSCFCRSVAVTIRRHSRVRETSRSRSAVVSSVSGYCQMAPSKRFRASAVCSGTSSGKKCPALGGASLNIIAPRLPKRDWSRFLTGGEQPEPPLRRTAMLCGMSTCALRRAHLLDDLVHLKEQLLRDCQAQRFGGLLVDGRFESRRLFDRQITRLCALEDLVHVRRGAKGMIGQSLAVAHEATCLCIPVHSGYRRQSILQRALGTPTSPVDEE